MKKVIKIKENDLHNIVKKVVEEASIDKFDTWAELNNIRGRNVLIGSDGTLTITNNANKPVKIKFSGKVTFVSIGVNVGRIDEVGSEIIITTKESKRKTRLNQKHVSNLLTFVDNPKVRNITFDGVIVQEPNSTEQKTGSIIAEKV